MKRVRQVFMEPGLFCTGQDEHGQPVYQRVTRDWIRDYIAGTRGMIEAGYRPDVFLAHKPKGSDEGAPRKLDDSEAARLRGSAGWLTTVDQDAEGRGVYELEITDSEVARKLEEGSIKFTSPEFRPAWLDGSGRLHRNVIGHVALTHKPRNVKQGPLVEQPALQFSLEDRMADDDDDETKPDDEKDGMSDGSGAGPADTEGQAGDPPNAGEPGSEGEAPPTAEKPEAPDMPEESAGDSKQAERVAAIVAHLEELGVSLPEDTPEQEMPTILDRILTGLKTAAAVKKQSEAESAADEAEEDDDGGEPDVLEQGGAVMQYSLTDAPKSGNRMFVRVVNDEVGKLRSRLAACRDSGRIDPALFKELEASLPGLQFSAEDASLVPSLTFDTLLGVLEQMPIGLHFSADDLAAQFGEPDHPDEENGKGWRSDGSPVTPAQAKALVDKQVAEGVKGIK